VPLRDASMIIEPSDARRWPRRACDLAHDPVDSFEPSDPLGSFGSYLGTACALVGAAHVHERAGRNQDRDDRDDERGETHGARNLSGTGDRTS
jgi:hypothetical protein